MATVENKLRPLPVRFVAEFAASFVFLATVIFTHDPIAITAALFVCIKLVSAFDCGHVNPAVSVTLLMMGKLSGSECIAFVVAQLLAASAAVLWVKAMTR